MNTDDAALHNPPNYDEDRPVPVTLAGYRPPYIPRRPVLMSEFERSAALRLARERSHVEVRERVPTRYFKPASKKNPTPTVPAPPVSEFRIKSTLPPPESTEIITQAR